MNIIDLNSMGKKGIYMTINSSVQKVFFTSDTHFGHTNIIKYCNRPFNDINEMNETLIQRWNSIVPKNGLVFHLGDFAFFGKEKYKELRSKLNGNIILISGNHDHRTQINDCFMDIQQQVMIKIDDRKIYLNHFPFLCYSGSWRGEDSVWQLFGHIHSGPLTKNGTDYQRLSYLFPTQLDIGVDGHDFYPWTWEEIKSTIYAQHKKSKEGY